MQLTAHNHPLKPFSAADLARAKALIDHAPARFYQAGYLAAAELRDGTIALVERADDWIELVINDTIQSAQGADGSVVVPYFDAFSHIVRTQAKHLDAIQQHSSAQHATCHVLMLGGGVSGWSVGFLRECAGIPAATTHHQASISAAQKPECARYQITEIEQEPALIALGGLFGARAFDGLEGEREASYPAPELIHYAACVEAALPQLSENFDVILGDCFSDGLPTPQLFEDQTLKALTQHLNAQGLVAFNIVAPDLSPYVAALKAHFASVTCINAALLANLGLSACDSSERYEVPVSSDASAEEPDNVIIIAAQDASLTAAFVDA